jgi:hypothetical protein
MKGLLRRKRATRPTTDRINLMICGARRSGTTSLEHYLQEHPEIGFLTAPDLEPIGGVPRGLPFNSPFTAMTTGPDVADEYRRAVAAVAGRTPCIAWRAVYAMWFPHIVFNIAEQLPGTRLLFSLRNPVDTAYSVYCRRLARGETRTFEELIRIDRLDSAPSEVGQILHRGFYEPALRLFHRLFPPDRILVYPFEDIVNRPAETMARVLRFLDLDDSYRFERLGTVKSASVKPAPMAPETRARLHELYAPYNARLFELLGWPADLWQ